MPNYALFFHFPPSSLKYCFSIKAAKGDSTQIIEAFGYEY